MGATDIAANRFTEQEVRLGLVIVSTRSAFDSTRHFAAIVLPAQAGTVLSYFVELAERTFIPRHLSRRRDESAPAMQG